MLNQNATHRQLALICSKSLIRICFFWECGVSTKQIYKYSKNIQRKHLHECRHINEFRILSVCVYVCKRFFDKVSKKKKQQQKVKFSHRHGYKRTHRPTAELHIFCLHNPLHVACPPTAEGFSAKVASVMLIFSNADLKYKVYF